jgi:hypothetical protein
MMHNIEERAQQMARTMELYGNQEGANLVRLLLVLSGVRPGAMEPVDAPIGSKWRRHGARRVYEVVRQRSGWRGVAYDLAAPRRDGTTHVIGVTAVQIAAKWERVDEAGRSGAK